MNRLQLESAFHDQQAEMRAKTFRAYPDKLRFADESYLEHAPWIRPAFEQLGDVRDRAMLDYGCGHGMAAVVLARAGARVTAVDVSQGYLKEAHQRARANGVTVRFLRADAERLPFRDASFDGIWGNAILHHLDIGRAGAELFRVLRPGGIGVFCEPWGENPLLRWARRRVWYPGKARTRDEEPLRLYHLERLQRLFAEVQIKGYQVLGMVRRLLGGHRFLACLDRLDAAILCRAPRLARYCRYLVITLRR